MQARVSSLAMSSLSCAPVLVGVQFLHMRSSIGGMSTQRLKIGPWETRNGARCAPHWDCEAWWTKAATNHLLLHKCTLCIVRFLVSSAASVRRLSAGQLEPPSESPSRKKAHTTNPRGWNRKWNFQPFAWEISCCWVLGPGIMPLMHWTAQAHASSMGLEGTPLGHLHPGQCQPNIKEHQRTS